MSIAFGSSGAAATGSSSLSCAYPSSIAAGDLLLLFVSSKYVAPTTPSGWILVSSAAVGSGTGADAGTVYLSVYKREADGSESGSLSVTITSGNAAIGQICRYTKSSSKQWDIRLGLANSSSNTGAGSTSFAASVGPSDLYGYSGSLLLGAAAINSDVATFSSLSISFSDGGSTVTERADTSTTTGDDCAIVIVDRAIASEGDGSSTTLSGVASTSLAASVRWSALILVLNEVAIACVGSGTDATGTTSLSCGYPANLKAGDLLLLAVANKYPSNGPSTPFGWTLVGQYDSTGHSPGADDGNTRTTVFSKVATGSESGSLTVTLTSANVSVGQMFAYRGAVAWDVAAATGAYSNYESAAAYGVSGSLAFDKSVDSILFSVVALNTDASSATSSVQSSFFDAEDQGSTFGDGGSLRGNRQTTTGDDLALFVHEQYVPAAAIDEEAPFVRVESFAPFASTVTAPAGEGGGIWLRIRELQQVNGSANLTLDAFTTTSAARAIASGSANLTLAAFTTTSAAISKVSATANLTPDAFTTASAAKVRVTGTASPTLDAFTTTSAGAVRGIGSASLTLDAFTTTSAARAIASATASVSIDAFTTTSAARAIASAQASLTLSAFTGSSAGTSAVKATADVTLDDFTVVAAGGPGVVTAAVSITIDAFTTTSAASAPAQATSSLTLDEFTASAVAIAVAAATADFVLDAFTASGAGAVRVSASADVTLDDFTSSSAAQASVKATVDVTPDAFTVTSTAQTGGVFALLVLDDFTVSATGTSRVRASADITLSEFSTASAASAPARAQASLDIAPFTAGAVAQAPVRGAVNVTLGSFAISAAAHVPVRASAVVTIEAFTVAAHGQRRQSRARFKVTSRKAVVMKVRILMGPFYVGDVHNIDVELFNADSDAPLLPSAISITVKRRSPDAEATTYTFGVDDEVSQLAPNKFRAAIPCSDAGEWDYSWISPGPAGEGVQPGFFYVNERPA